MQGRKFLRSSDIFAAGIYAYNAKGSNQAKNTINQVYDDFLKMQDVLETEYSK